MAKNAVRVAVRNVVRVVRVPPALAAQVRTADRKVCADVRPSIPTAPELLSGVSWDDGRRVWLVHPSYPPARG